MNSFDYKKINHELHFITPPSKKAAAAPNLGFKSARSKVQDLFFADTKSSLISAAEVEY